jgi:predicted GNAT superfamily acetyltransferase
MSFEIVELEYAPEMRELAEVFARVWERPGEPPISPDTLRALAYSGSYVAGARSGSELVGGAVGWFGGVPRDLHLHSHILGVLPGNETQGLGFALKQHQRDWCLARGVRFIEWTFDPLVRRNAYFNLAKLGAEAAHYYVDLYGPMDDGINAGDRSDRIVIRWELDSPKAKAAAEGHPHEVDMRSLEVEGAERILTVGPDDEPVEGELIDQVVALCQVPEDIVAIRRDRPELARRWREALGLQLGAGAFDFGYDLVGFTRDGWYVLRRGHR